MLARCFGLSILIVSVVGVEVVDGGAVFLVDGGGWSVQEVFFVETVEKDVDRMQDTQKPIGVLAVQVTDSKQVRLGHAQLIATSQ
jgi:hypothetical protein